MNLQIFIFIFILYTTTRNHSFEAYFIKIVYNKSLNLYLKTKLVFTKIIQKPRSNDYSIRVTNHPPSDPSLVNLRSDDIRERKTGSRGRKYQFCLQPFRSKGGN